MDATLTERETQVLKLMLEGQPNKAISRRIGLGIRTVEACRAGLYQKFGVRSPAQLGYVVGKQEADNAST